MRETEDEWTGLMRLAISGDGAAYHRLLKAVTPVLRAGARRGLARAGQPVDQSEDVVQEILLAVHLKRHTWDANAPFAPWLFAIARNKLIDRAASPRSPGFRQYRRFRRNHPGRACRGDRVRGRDRSPVAVPSGPPARRLAVDRGRKCVDQGYGREIRDERGRGAGGAASRARQPHRQTAGAMRMETEQLIRTLAADNLHRARPVGLRAGDGVACRGAGFNGDVPGDAGRSAGRHDGDA